MSPRSSWRWARGTARVSAALFALAAPAAEKWTPVDPKDAARYVLTPEQLGRLARTVPLDAKTEIEIHTGFAQSPLSADEFKDAQPGDPLRCHVRGYLTRNVIATHESLDSPRAKIRFYVQDERGTVVACGEGSASRAEYGWSGLLPGPGRYAAVICAERSGVLLGNRVTADFRAYVTGRHVAAPPSGATNAPLPWTAGTISAETPSAGNAGFTYFHRMPATARPGEKAPVLFVFGDAGCLPYTVGAYADGADVCGFAVVGSVQSGAVDVDEKDLVKHLVADALARLPLDPDQIYVTGFRGGAHKACAVADRLKSPCRGALLCGVSSPPKDLPRAPVCAFCALNCSWRGSFAVHCGPARTKDAFVAYYAGGDASWAPRELLHDGLISMYARALKKLRAPPPAVARQRDAFAARLLADAESKAKSDPARAGDWCEAMKDCPMPTDLANRFRTLAAALAKDPAVLRERAARDDLWKFAEKMFGRDAGIREAALALSARHPGTRVADLAAGIVDF